MYSKETREALFEMADEYQQAILKLDPLLDMIDLFVNNYEVDRTTQSQYAQIDYANSAQILWSLFCLIKETISGLTGEEKRIWEKYFPAETEAPKTA